MNIDGFFGKDITKKFSYRTRIDFIKKADLFLMLLKIFDRIFPCFYNGRHFT